ncbi:proline-rich acidic protein 1 [Apus apus]|uniref:proline-rich acidic protein 1 n=1 Tax=Apus apus TaxID=8895 RepID=UPI0021F81DE9|nr:proline-rich acidic protein 1 [Apus apus]
MERTAAARLCSIAVLLGAALLLPSPGDTQAPGDIGRQDLAKDIALGVRAVEPPEEGGVSNEVEPGIKVFSSSAWAPWSPHQAQAGPEEDRDHLYHPQDEAREADVQGPLMLSLEVQSGPEEDRDYLYHS